MERVAKIAIKGLGLRLVRKGSGDKGNAVPQSQNFLIILFGTVSNYPKDTMELSSQRKEVLQYEIFGTNLRKRVVLRTPSLYTRAERQSDMGTLHVSYIDAEFGVNISCSANLHFDLHAGRP